MTNIKKQIDQVFTEASEEFPGIDDFNKKWLNKFGNTEGQVYDKSKEKFITTQIKVITKNIKDMLKKEMENILKAIFPNNANINGLVDDTNENNYVFQNAIFVGLSSLKNPFSDNELKQMYEEALTEGDIVMDDLDEEDRDLEVYMQENSSISVEVFATWVPQSGKISVEVNRTVAFPQDSFTEESVYEVEGNSKTIVNNFNKAFRKDIGTWLNI